jgi:hypothetical protein
MLQGYNEQHVVQVQWCGFCCTVPQAAALQCTAAQHETNSGEAEPLPTPVQFCKLSWGGSQTVVFTGDQAHVYHYHHVDNL